MTFRRLAADGVIEAIRPKKNGPFEAAMQIYQNLVVSVFIIYSAFSIKWLLNTEN